MRQFLSWSRISQKFHHQVRFEVLTAASMKMAVFCVVASCSLVEVYWRLRGACCLHHQAIALKRRQTSARLHGTTQKTAIFVHHQFHRSVLLDPVLSMLHSSNLFTSYFSKVLYFNNKVLFTAFIRDPWRYDLSAPAADRHLTCCLLCAAHGSSSLSNFHSIPQEQIWTSVSFEKYTVSTWRSYTSRTRSFISSEAMPAIEVRTYIRK
jgi:hypothetical protein